MHTAPQVLVVDDDEGIREFVAMALSSAGYDVMSAPDGAAALDLLATSQPDVILLDMLMPKVDGWEFARLYEQWPGAHAPIIVLTAARDAQARAAEIKADAWLAKPFHLDALFACLEQYATQP
ncbi:MAG TPA: response regulator [Chloroflexota bacterium]|nr:response regulator [Chloroflexota bacterium]